MLELSNILSQSYHPLNDPAYGFIYPNQRPKLYSSA